MEEVEKEPKEVKQLTASLEERKYEPTGTSELPGSKPPAKEFTWRDPWLQLHM
jgi:hypothetical protein